MKTFIWSKVFENPTKRQRYKTVYLTSLMRKKNYNSKKHCEWQLKTIEKNKTLNLVHVTSGI